MKARKLLVYLVVALFSLDLASPVLSSGMGDEATGTVTRIDGGKVSIKDSMGGEKTIEPKNPEALTDLKVGDQASVKDGILKKTGGTGPSAPPRPPGY